MMTRKRFLIVEDEFLVALEMETILCNAGFEIVGTSETRTGALQLIADHELDAAFIDCNLNGQSSHDVAEALSGKRVPFAFVTGYERKSLPPTFGNAPMVDKPFNAARLLNVANELLQAAPMKQTKNPFA
jgi:two-component SAPR family response regulator